MATGDKKQKSRAKAKLNKLVAAIEKHRARVQEHNMKGKHKSEKKGNKNMGFGKAEKGLSKTTDHERKNGAKGVTGGKRHEHVEPRSASGKVEMKAPKLGNVFTPEGRTDKAVQIQTQPGAKRGIAVKKDAHGGDGMYEHGL
jgi:hypothetical protein